MRQLHAHRATRPRRTPALLLAALLAAASLGAPRPARAADFDLTVCNPDPLVNGAALVAAIATANSNGRSDTIRLGACAYELDTPLPNSDGSSGLPAIKPDGGHTLTLIGADWGGIPYTQIMRASDTPAFRLLFIESGATVKLQNVALHRGFAQGRDGDNGASPTAGSPGRGGAVYNQGSLELWGVHLEGNIAQGGAGGAGQAGGAAEGGAIYNQGTLSSDPYGHFSEISSSRVLGGAGGAGVNGGAGGPGGLAAGGAISSAPGATFSLSGIIYARSDWAYGGAGGAGGENMNGTGGAGGAGGAAQAGALFYTGSTFPKQDSLSLSYNGATGGAGGAGGAGINGGTGGAGGLAEGGALVSTQARLNLGSYTMFEENRVSGGAGGAGGAASGGTGGVGGAAGRAQGGALKVAGISPDSSGLIFLSLYANQVTGGAGGAGGAGGGTGRAGGVALGGALFSDGDVSLPASGLISQNQATGGAGAPDAGGGPAFGGAIFTGRTAALGGSTFSDNSAQGGPGGAGADGGTARGGALYTLAGVAATKTEFSSNQAMGGSGGQDGAGGPAQGGAVYATGGASLREPTLTNNRAQGGQGTGRGAGGTAQGGALFSPGGSLLDGSAEGNIAQAGRGSTTGASGAALAQGGMLYSSSGALLFAGGQAHNNQAIGGAAVYGDGQRGGDAQGGAIYIALGGSLDLSNASPTGRTPWLDGNSAVGGKAGASSGLAAGNPGGRAQGGAIYSAGPLSLSQAFVGGNTATGGQGGDITDETGFPQSGQGGPGGAASGGAIYLAGGSSTLVRLELSNNSVAGGSGGSGGAGVGQTGSADGGGITSTGGAALTIRTSRLNGNQAPGAGGALLASASGPVSISDTTLNSNGASSGGALLASGSGLVSISGSTFNGNHASSGGALTLRSTSVAGQPGLRLVNTTIDSNTATGDGGGLELRAPAELDHLTITGNTVSKGDGGGIWAAAGTLTMRNTILAQNRDTGGVFAPDLAGSLSGSGYNLIGNGVGAAGFSATDRVGTAAAPLNPRLDALNTSSGPTATRLPQAGSPAINAGDPAFGPAPPYDQRGTGFPRISGGRTDIGAVEVQ